MRFNTFGSARVLGQAALAVSALMSLSACAETGAPPTATAMHLGSAAFAPQGYIHFCERRPDQCGLPAPIPASDRVALERTLNQQQWANVFNLAPTSIPKPKSAAVEAVALVEPAQPEAPPETTPPQAAAPLELASVDLNSGALLVEQPEIVTVTPTPPEAPAPQPTPDPVFNPAPRPEPTAASAPAPALAAFEPSQKPVAIHLTPLVWSALNGVNQSINARIRPMTDEQAFGMTDYWTLPLTDGPRPVGNCKHYVLEKRKALVDAGFSPDALSIAIVKTGWGEVHAVLIVSTDQGDYVLDNLTPWIKGWQDVRYSWIERQAPGAPLKWAKVADNGEARAS